MGIFRDVSIKAAGSDLISYLRADRPYNLLMWLAACLPPAAIMATFYYDAMEKATPPDPGVFYFESWPASRSMEDVKRDQALRAVREQALQEKKKNEYKALGRALGMDVEEIERQAEARQLAAEKAKAQSSSEAARGAAR